jgi:hypothetical protein
VDHQPERVMSCPRPRAPPARVAQRERHWSWRYSQVSGRPRFHRRSRPPPTKTPMPMPATISVGTIAMLW